MLNKSTSRSEYVIQSGVTQYPVGFEFLYNGDDTPQIRVTIGAMVAEENVHFVISEDLLTINLIPLEEEAPADPNDYSWLEKWVGMSLVIERDIPFVQESDYQVGRISPERIEKDFDLSVMRDQMLADKVDSKLPLTGGTLTGPLTIVGRGFTPRVLSLKHEDSGTTCGIIVSEAGVQMPFKLYGMHTISPTTLRGPQTLGTLGSRWDTVYTTKISNGSDISVPEKSGTMALLEDVEGKADKTELSNYLPLTGGALTNLLSFHVSGEAGKNKGLIYVKTASGDTPLIGAKIDDDGLLRDVAVIPKLQTETFQGSQILSSFIGTTTSPVTRIHAKKIGTGLISKLLTIPDGPGTIARLEDIPETYTKEELDAKFAEIPAPIDAYTKAEVDAKLSSVYKFKGSVANVNALPTGASVGDTYNVEDTGANYAWDGSKWDKLSDTVDLTGYATEEYVDDNTSALVEYIGNEIRPLKTDNKNLYNNQLVLRDMLNEKDENNEFIQLTTEAQAAIPAINELNEKKASKEDLGGYLPLSGGTVGGELSLEGVGTRPTFLTLKNTEHNRTCRFGVNYVGQLTFNFSDKSTDDFIFSPAGSIQSTSSISRDLGSVYYPWRRTYCEILNNGADLIVPTEGGTLARLEDLEGIGGGGAEIGPELDVEHKFTSWFYGFNSSDGYFYFDNIYGVDSPEDVSCFALTNQVYSGSPHISIVNRSHGAFEDGEHYSFTEEWFGPGEATNPVYPKNLGREEAPWQTVYATKLNNGADLELPTEGGTIARIEDIDERIGDISTALAAILGE